MTAALKVRPPTGLVAPPFILLEGSEKSGKSWAAATLSGSERIGATYWIDLGEGSADEYGAVPGARYAIVDTDGTWHDLLEQVDAVTAAAAKAHAAGDAPVLLVIDSISDEWEGLKDWASERARGSKGNQAKLKADPNAEVDIGRNLWNDARSRHRRLMTKLLTFPGVVVAIARGKEISATDPQTGQPFRDGRKTWSVESEKSLPFDATAWVRLHRENDPLIIGTRSTRSPVRPGDKPRPVPAKAVDRLLEWVIFDVLQYDPAARATRQMVNTTGGELTADERAADVDQAPTSRPPAASRDRVQPKRDPGTPAPVALDPHKVAEAMVTTANLDALAQLPERVGEAGMKVDVLDELASRPELLDTLGLTAEVDEINALLFGTLHAAVTAYVAKHAISVIAGSTPQEESS